MSAELRMRIEAQAERIHRLATASAEAAVERLSLETAELQALIAEAAREERITRPCDPRQARFAQA